MSDRHADSFALTATVKGKLPRLPFADMKNTVLGNSYELSLVLIGDKLSERLHIERYGKPGPANILSFPLTKKSGEIFINIRKAARESSKFERTFEKYIGFLFIHGLVHLKGMRHGSRMESEEKKVRARFNI